MSKEKLKTSTRGKSAPRKFGETEEFTSGALDVTNQYSLINMLPETFKMKDALIDCADILEESSFYDLQKGVEETAKPNDRKLIDSIRLSFWHEQSMAQAEGREISPSRVYSAFCGYHKFRKLIAKPKIAAYIFTRPADDHVSLKRVLDKGYERLEEVLSLPLVKYNGNPDVALIKEVREIVKMVDNRLNGGVVQKIHQTSLNVNHNNGSSKGRRELTEEEIDKQLLELQKKMNPNSLVIEVDAGRKSEAVEVEAIGTTTEESEA